MDAPSDATHVFRFREIHLDRQWRPRMFGSGVAYSPDRPGVEAEVRVVAEDGTEIVRRFSGGQVLVFDDIVHLPRREADHGSWGETGVRSGEPPP